MGFFDKKPDHPMADIKSAQQFMQDLPKNDAIKALQEILEWVESVESNADFRIEQRWETICLLDETARPYVQKLVREYYAENAPSAFQEARIWSALNTYYGDIAQAYLRLQTAHRQGEKGSVILKPHLALIAARGMHALRGKLKCATAHYEKVDHSVWQHLASFYSHAESQQYADTPLKLYADAAQEVTPRYKFLATLMWFAAIASRLNPLRTHIAEKLADHWRNHFVISTQLNSHSIFYFNLLHSATPARITAESPAHAGIRYLGVNDINPQIEALYKVLEKGIIPDHLKLGNPYDPAVVSEVVRTLASYWAQTLPARRNVRHQVKIRLTVTHGFTDILQHVTDPTAASAATVWEAEDISTNGFRCILRGTNSNGIKVGTLIAA